MNSTTTTTGTHESHTVRLVKFQIKPARRQTLYSSDDLPPSLSSQPYKYCIKVGTQNKLRFQLLIQRESPESTEYCPIPNGLRLQNHTTEEPNTQAFLIQFLFSSFLKGRRKFKLEIAEEASGKVLFVSSSFILNARKKPSQDAFWRSVKSGTAVSSAREESSGENTESVLGKRKREQDDDASVLQETVASTSTMAAFSGRPLKKPALLEDYDRFQFQEPDFGAGTSIAVPNSSASTSSAPNSETSSSNPDSLDDAAYLAILDM